MPATPTHDPDATDPPRTLSAAQPDSAQGWVRLGEAYIEGGQAHAAPRCFARAAELEPDSARHWARLGKVLLALREHAGAQDALHRACALEPESAAWQTLLGYALREQNDSDGALAAFARARVAQPGSLQAAVGEALMLPPVYRDMDELRRWRERFADGLERLEAERPRQPGWASQVLSLEWENFTLAHQGGDDRPLQQRYAAFLASLLARAVPDLQAGVERPRRRGRLRVGFLSAEFRRSTVGDYFASWLLELPRDRFEVRGYFSGHLKDELTARLAAGCDRFEQVAGPVDAIARRVRSEGLDLLVLPDVGLSAQSYLLANLRLAPVQCAAWGHPVTTGSRCIDHYLSCAEMEPAGAAAHYSEQLILLPGLGTRYARPPPAPPRSRAHFGLPADAHIYVCPNRLHKILPHWDERLLDILLKDVRAVLVFFDAVAPGQRQAFVERMERAMRARGVVPRRQLKLLPLLPHAEFRAALALADVMLDTDNFSAGSSALDALAVGLPIVAAEGEFMRGRQSAAMLRRVGVPELIAPGADRYVALALQVAGDRAYRAALSERIRAGLGELFDRGEALTALATAFEQRLA